jgi:cytochrome c biogenesis protein CcdA
MRRWKAHVALFAVSLAGGAVTLGATLALIGSWMRPPEILVGITAVIAGAMAAGLLPSFPASRWRVPRSFSMFGEGQFVLVFGFVLGLGVLTALPSFGFYVLVAWGLTGSLYFTLPAFLAFSAGRALPVITAAVFWRGDEITRRTSQVRRSMRALRGVEAVILGAVAGLLLA